ncbi:MAG: 4-hydroxythreonine-4-phosphate dehydrogenase PdxA [Peptococcaceae bacterium]|nr:4-hydroxythreonine-4-phosphate dehydrogenase PdxA [Peptococcaceae bacterium]
MICSIKEEKPIVGITMGDPAGVGPEIIAKALSTEMVCETTKPIVIGNAAIFERTIANLGLELKVNAVQDPKEAKFNPGIIDVFEATQISADSIQPGVIQRLGGQAAFDCISKSIELALAKKIDAVATAPIQKEAIKAAGVQFVGHTEMYEKLTAAEYALTVFTVRNLRVFFLTRHLSLRDACDQVKEAKVFEFLVQLHKELGKLGMKNPKIAVAALNPHGGDGGLFGNEDRQEVLPAIEKAREIGMDVLGPVPADSVFHLGLQGKYDAILSLYHDQGHIATKTLDFERTISITLGLPFIRTSVDHGTAFDIAGKGIASSVSMEEAIILAARYNIMQKNNM